MKGESSESTTAYGLHFLETIRRTKDKRCDQSALLLCKGLATTSPWVATSAALAVTGIAVADSIIQRSTCGKLL